MPRRRRIVRATFGKDPIKHAHTIVEVHGQGSPAVLARTLLTSATGDRSLDGSGQTIQDSATTGESCLIGSVTKYLNIIIQSVITNDGFTTNAQGFVEWAIVFSNEVSITPLVTNTGVQTLGVICSRMFRGDCLMTGQFPVGHVQPMVETISLKLPKKCIKTRIGNNVTLFWIYRSNDTTDLESNTIKSTVSCHFKNYN